MELGIGTSARAVVAGRPHSKPQYGPRPDGTRGRIGVEHGPDGQPLAQLLATLVGGPTGWVESATAVAPAALLDNAPPPGTLVEITGDLRMSVRGGDFGSTRATVTGVVGLRPLGSAVEPLLAVAADNVASTSRSSRS